MRAQRQQRASDLTMAGVPENICMKAQPLTVCRPELMLYLRKSPEPTPTNGAIFLFDGHAYAR